MGVLGRLEFLVEWWVVCLHNSGARYTIRLYGRGLEFVIMDRLGRDLGSYLRWGILGRGLSF